MYWARVEGKLRPLPAFRAIVILFHIYIYYTRLLYLAESCIHVRKFKFRAESTSACDYIIIYAGVARVNNFLARAARIHYYIEAVCACHYISSRSIGRNIIAWH